MNPSMKHVVAGYMALGFGVLFAVTAGAEPALDVAPEVPPVTLNDFAFGVSLQVTEDASVYQTTLPESVYRRVTRAALTDISVFNAAGHPVPHATREPPSVQTPSPRAEMRWFPLTGKASEVAAPVTVEVDSGGAVVRVTASVGTPTSAAVPDVPAPAAYLLDGSGLDLAPSSFHLVWGTDAPVWARLTVEASADLEAWSVIGSGVVASLQHLGQTLERTDLEVSRPQDARYFRLTAEEGTLPPVRQILAGFESMSQQDALATLTVTPQIHQPNTFRFDLGGPFPVTELELDLQEKNSLVHAEISASSDAQGPYAKQAEGRFYRVDGRTPLKSTPAQLGAPTRARYWQVKIDARGGGVGAAPPKLIARYRPDQLLWVARGEGPFVLAYGNSLAEQAAFQALELLPGGGAPVLPTATTDAERPLGGAARLTAVREPPAMDWKQVTLWGVLCAGALMLVVLCVRLLKSAPAGS